MGREQLGWSLYNGSLAREGVARLAGCDLLCIARGRQPLRRSPQTIRRAALS